MIMAAPGQILARVLRNVIPPGAFLPRQEYLRTGTPDEPWVLDRLSGDVFEWQEADQLARKLTTPEIHVFPVVLHGKDGPPMPARGKQVAQDLTAPRTDWHRGKPNCGVE